MVFAPSTFIGFKDNSILNFSGKLLEHETNPVLTKIIGSTPKIDKTLDELFLDFCDEVAINRNDVGLSRDYSTTVMMYLFYGRKIGVYPFFYTF